ncbi:MAG: hypothetical protein KF770_05905 [Anaerolineae bacterium]|nr:hypothetical protein [Anaerolineae bacterium]
MADVLIEITLLGGETDYGYKRYAPGEALRGNLTVYPDSDIKCKNLYLRLLWHTAGRGTQFLEKVQELNMFSGTLSGGSPRSFDFEFVLPQQPWSFEGHYISTVWKVQAQVDVAWASDPKGEALFVLRPLADKR